jgi:peptidyl-prolyl cis-trans isomerase SurA
MANRRGEFLARMIDQKILLVKAKYDSLQVDDDRVIEAADRQYNNVLRQVGSEQRLSQMYNMPISRIKRFIERNIREQMLVEMVQSEMMGDVRVGRQEVESFYRAKRDSLPTVKATVKLGHIVRTVRPSGDVLDAAYAQADSLFDRILAGEDFSLLAQKFSQDPGSAKNGGDLGFTERGQFVPEFEKAAYDLQVGETSKPVLSKFGYHIIQLLERRGERIHTRHILISVQPNDGDIQLTRERLLTIRDDILNERIRFSDAALEYSDDPNVESDLGILGLFEKERISIQEFQAVADITEEGAISEPFQTRFGLHILYVIEKNPERPMNLDDDFEKVRMVFLNRQREEMLAKTIEQLREEIPIQVLMNN